MPRVVMVLVSVNAPVPGSRISTTAMVTTAISVKNPIWPMEPEPRITPVPTVVTTVPPKPQQQVATSITVRC